MRTFLFLFSLCMAITAFAQDDSSWEVNHYEHTRTFVEEGYTYQCDVKYGYVTLYNAANQWTYADQIDNRTGKLYTRLYASLINLSPKRKPAGLRITVLCLPCSSVL